VVLSEQALETALTDLPGWEGDPNAIRCTVEFPDFPTAIHAVVRVADVAEEMDHHPDIDIRWRRVTFTLSTHSAGGVTALDTALAERITGIAGALT
jgi:4a-hydroxytetrahydrobiopterin dehydratase